MKKNSIQTLRSTSDNSDHKEKLMEILKLLKRDWKFSNAKLSYHLLQKFGTSFGVRPLRKKLKAILQQQYFKIENSLDHAKEQNLI